MSITDELRKRIDDEALLLSTRRELWNIADRIDAEHEIKMGYWQGTSYKDGYDEGLAFCDRLREAAQGREDVTLWGVDYVALPLDAEGEPIHMGDEIEIIGGEHGTVVAIELCEDGGWNVSMRPTGWDTPTLFAAESVRHHHPPTVEDVLREFADEVRRCCDTADTIAEYAAKLRLAGEDE